MKLWKLQGKLYQSVTCPVSTNTLGIYFLLLYAQTHVFVDKTRWFASLKRHL